MLSINREDFSQTETVSSKTAMFSNLPIFIPLICNNYVHIIIQKSNNAIYRSQKKRLQKKINSIQNEKEDFVIKVSLETQSKN